MHGTNVWLNAETVEIEPTIGIEAKPVLVKGPDGEWLEVSTLYTTCTEGCMNVDKNAGHRRFTRYFDQRGFGPHCRTHPVKPVAEWRTGQEIANALNLYNPKALAQAITAYARPENVRSTIKDETTMSTYPVYNAQEVTNVGDVRINPADNRPYQRIAEAPFWVPFAPMPQGSPAMPGAQAQSLTTAKRGTANIQEAKPATPGWSGKSTAEVKSTQVFDLDGKRFGVSVTWYHPKDRKTGEYAKEVKATYVNVGIIRDEDAFKSRGEVDGDGFKVADGAVVPTSAAVRERAVAYAYMQEALCKAFGITLQ